MKTYTFTIYYTLTDGSFDYQTFTTKANDRANAESNLKSIERYYPKSDEVVSRMITNVSVR